MKAVRLLLTMVSCGVLMQGVSSAEPPKPVSKLALYEDGATSPSDRPQDEGTGIKPRVKTEGTASKQSRGTKASHPQAQDRFKASHDRTEEKDRTNSLEKSIQDAKSSSQARVKSPSGDRALTTDRRPKKNSQANATTHPPSQERPQALPKRHDPSDQRRDGRGEAANPPANGLRHSTVSTRAGAKGGLAMDKGNRPYPQPLRPVSPSVALPSPSALHPRGSAPAILGAAVSPSSRSTAAISGTGMSHRF